MDVWYIFTPWDLKYPFINMLFELDDFFESL